MATEVEEHFEEVQAEREKERKRRERLQEAYSRERLRLTKRELGFIPSLKRFRSWQDIKIQREIRKEELEKSKREKEAAEEEKKLAKKREKELLKEEKRTRYYRQPPVEVHVDDKHKQKGIGLVGLLITIVVIGVILHFAFQTGYAQSQIENLKTFSDNIGLSEKFQSSLGFFRTSLEPGSYQWINPAAKSIETVQSFGVNIREFGAIKPFYLTNEEVKLIGTVGVNNKIIEEVASRDFELNFMCSANNTEVKGEISGGEQSTRTIHPGEEIDFQVFCTFLIDTFKIDKSKKEKTEKIDMEASYDYNVRSSYDVYVVESESEKQDFFKKRDLLGKGNVRQDGTVISTYQGGPVEVNIGFGRTGLKQPLTSGKYGFFVGLVKKWNGELEELKSLKLVFPPEMSIDAENCIHFDANGMLKEEVLKDVNDQNCKSLKDVGQEFKREEGFESISGGFGCLEDYLSSTQYAFFCTIDIGQSQEELLKIGALTNYKYKVSKSANVKFFNPEYEEPTGGEGE